MNFQDWVTACGQIMPQPLASPFNAAAPFQLADYNTLIPRAIEFAELMMYRDPDLDFLVTTKVDATGVFSSGTRSFTVPASIIVVKQLAAVVPAPDVPSAGTRVQFLPASLEFINQAWPAEAQTATPSVAGPGPWFAMQDNVTAIVAPTPNANYVAEVTGVYRPTALAQTANATTYLTSNLPDMFLSASMVFWAGVMKDYGQASDDPRLAQTWSAIYQEQKKGAAVESARAKAQGAGWSPQTQANSTGMPRS